MGEDSELERMGDWSNAVLDYLLMHEPGSITSRGMKSLLPKIIEDGDLREMKYLFGDLLEFVGLLPPEYQVELDKYLREEIDRGLFDEIRSKNKRIALIIRRGEVADDDEYRLLLERFNDTTKIGKKTEALNELVLKYEKSRMTLLQSPDAIPNAD